MSNPNDNDPAFPIPHFARPDGRVDYGLSGLTKRELFAAMAMQGILANPCRQTSTSETYAEAAIDGVRYADALLAELAKPREGA